MVKLAPLTGFFGTNSSGKSSLLQMLLLLKQTSWEQGGSLFSATKPLLLTLAIFREVIHDHKQEETSLGI